MEQRNHQPQGHVCIPDSWPEMLKRGKSAAITEYINKAGTERKAVEMLYDEKSKLQYRISALEEDAKRVKDKTMVCITMAALLLAGLVFGIIIKHELAGEPTFIQSILTIVLMAAASIFASGIVSVILIAATAFPYDIVNNSIDYEHPEISTARKYVLYAISFSVGCGIFFILASLIN